MLADNANIRLQGPLQAINDAQYLVRGDIILIASSAILASLVMAAARNRARHFGNGFIYDYRAGTAAHLAIFTISRKM